MTQVLSVVTRRHVFHVSDRLLSQQAAGKILPFDRNSNKAVVFCAKDAHVVVAYTGRAFLDHIPTDTFIAQSLLGAKLSGGDAFIGVGNSPGWTDIGRSVERLRRDLSDAFRRLPLQDRAGNFQVSVMGWRQRVRRNRRITPVVWHLERSATSGDQEFHVARHQRWWRWDRGYTVSMIPEISSDIEHWLRSQLREHGGKSPDEMRRILVEGLRRCADARPETVGYSCIQVALTPTASPHAKVKYISDTRAPLGVRAKREAYSPWIVAPPMAYAPAVMRGGTEGGGWTNASTGYTWTYEGPLGELAQDADEASRVPRRRALVSHSAQPRRQDPQKRR